jgi:hypothetical protein
MLRGIGLILIGLCLVGLGASARADGGGYQCYGTYTPCGAYTCIGDPHGSGFCALPRAEYKGGQCYTGAGSCVMTQHQCEFDLYSHTPGCATCSGATMGYRSTTGSWC